MPQLSRNQQWRNKSSYVKRDGTEVTEHRQRYAVKTHSNSPNMVVSADVDPSENRTIILATREQDNDIDFVNQSVPLKAEEVSVEHVNEDTFNIHATGKKVVVDNEGNHHMEDAESVTIINKIYKSGVKER